MKKTFSFESSDKPVPRHIESIKSEIKKYLARERKKKIPEGFDIWIFDCKFGDTEAEAKTVFANEIKTLIDDKVSEGKKSCYVEILSSPGKMKKKEKAEGKKKPIV